MKVEVFMQVNSVSVNKASFGNRPEVTRYMAEQFAKMDDKTLKTAAYQQATVDVNTKKHNRIGKAIFWSIPLAAGLAAVVKNPAKTATKILNTNTSRLSNLGKFAGTALNWASTFAIIDVVFGASRKLEMSNEKTKQFSKEHPTLSFIAKVGTAVGALALAGFGFSKLARKAASKPGKFATKKLVYKFNNALNNSKVLNKVSKGLDKVPSAIKGFAKGVAEWSPMLLILTSLSHSLNHSRALAVKTGQNYGQLKESQAMIKEQLAKEAEAVEDNAEV